MGTGRDPRCSDLMRADAELCDQYMTVYILIGSRYYE